MACTVAGAIIAGVRSQDTRKEEIAAVAEAEIDALEAHRDTLKSFERLDTDEAKADVLEDGPLPLWRHALQLADEAGADVAAQRLHRRVVSTEYLIDAFRTGDEEQLHRSEHAWVKARELNQPPEPAAGDR